MDAAQPITPLHGLLWVSVRVRFRCRGCGLPSPLNGLDLDGIVDCLRCGLQQAFDVDDWPKALEHAHAVTDLAGSPEGRNPRPDVSIEKVNPYRDMQVGQHAEKTVSPSLQIEAGPGEPVCSECQGPLAFGSGGPGQITSLCQRCGAKASFQLHSKAKEIGGRLVGATADDHRTDRPDVTVVMPISGGAIAIKCPQCAAPLEVTEGSHFLKCQFCQTHARIPAKLLHKLFEAEPQPETWWMAFFGSSQMRRDLEEKVEPGIHKVGPPAIAVPAKKVPTYIPILIAVPLIALLYFIFDVHSWDGTTPMTCTAFDEVNIAGVEAQMRDGPMIVARGHCKLTCSDCVLTADRVIEVHEHATVRLSGGQIMGSSAAAVVTDYGQLINDQGTLSGPVSVMGHSIVQNFGVMTGPLFTAESGTALQLSAPPPDDD